MKNTHSIEGERSQTAEAMRNCRAYMDSDAFDILDPWLPLEKYIYGPSVALLHTRPQIREPAALRICGRIRAGRIMWIARYRVH